MRRDHRWFRNPLLTGIALLGAVASTLWAWRVSMVDMEVDQRVERLHSPSGDERIAALVELTLLVSVQSNHTVAAFQPVIEATKDHNPQVRAQALITLSDICGPLISGGLEAVARQLAKTTILEHMRDPSPVVRQAAAASLARLGPVPPEALQTLALLANDRSDSVMRSIAVERLSQMERPMPEAFLVIRQALNDAAPAVRATAVTSLGPWVATNSDAARAVFARLVDSDPGVRASVVALFRGSKLTPPTETIPDLIALLELPEQAPGTVAALVLPRMGVASATTAAPSLLANIDRGLHSGLGLGPFGLHLRTLFELGLDGQSAQATRALLCRCLLSYPEPGSRQFAASCLSRYGRYAGDSLPALREALSDPDEWVRGAVKRAIDAIEADQKHADLQSLS
jgi:HEAT repeat protein